MWTRLAVSVAESANAPAAPDDYKDFLVAAATALPVLFLPGLFLLITDFKRASEQRRRALALCVYSTLFANAEVVALLGIANHKPTSLRTLDGPSELAVVLILLAVLAGLSLGLIPLLEEGFPPDSKSRLWGVPLFVLAALGAPVVLGMKFMSFSWGFAVGTAFVATTGSAVFLWLRTRRPKKPPPHAAGPTARNTGKGVRAAEK